MIKKSIFAVCSLALALTVSAQNAYDAERLVGSELNGTARFVGMGGAMGALGGDISVMGTNPAGIGIFRSNDLSMSFGFNNTETKSTFERSSMSEDRTRASFDQLGFVYSYHVGNNTSLRYINFGFNYHKSKNFNRLFSAGGALNGLSQSWQLADAMDYAGMTTPSSFDKMMEANNPYQTYWNEYPVLSMMGATTGVVDWPIGADYLLGWDGNDNSFYSQETGGIDQYDFNVAFNVEDRVYFGATLGVYDVNYKRYSSYSENLYGDDGGDIGYYTLDNYYGLTGVGVDLKLGVIVRPIEESPFRLGLAIHTPTWYELTESYDATMSSDILAYDEAYSRRLSDYLDPDYLIYDYTTITPWKFNLSAGTTLGNFLAVGAEYEYQDYSATRLQDVEGYELGEQYTVEECLKAVHTFRAGLEARVAEGFSVRAGYNYTSAAFDESAYSSLTSYRTSTDFNNVKAKNTFTFGIGYRGSLIYADLAYKLDMYKSDFYAFDDISLPATQVDNSRHQLLFTLGARF